MGLLSFEDYQNSAEYSELCGHRIAHWQSDDFVNNAHKQTILLIHGFPSAAWDWHYQWKHLAAQYRLISLDMLGFGLSDKPHEHQYSLLEQADIIDALLAKLAVKNCHVLAHDYGDSVAQELLSRQSNQQSEYEISSMCFLNGGLFSAYHRAVFTQKLLKSPLGSIASRFMNRKSLAKGFNKVFGAATPPSEEEINVLWRLMEHNQGRRVLPKLLTYIDERKIQGKKWVSSMIATDIPLYFINGVQDPISGQHMLDHYIEVIPNPRTTALDVGHYPQLEAPQEVLSLYTKFLTEISE